MQEFPIVMDAFQPTKSGDAILESRIINSELEAELFAKEFPLLKTRISPFPIKVQAWLEGATANYCMSEKLVSKQSSLMVFIEKWQQCTFKVVPLSDEEKIRYHSVEHKIITDMTEQERNEVISRIKEKVKTLHAVSVIDSLREFRDGKYEIDPNYEVRITQPLIESISMQLISADRNYQRYRSGDKDYCISLKIEDTEPKNTNIHVGGNFEGILNTGKVEGNQSSEIARDSPRTESTSNSNPIRPKTKSWLEILSWIIGIIVGTMVIYEFILKHIFHTQSIF
jgi:hypothetical protein